MYIRLYENFKDFNKILYVFDLDDTLVSNPKFSDYIKSLITNESFSISKYLNSSLNEIGRLKSDLKIQDGRYYIDDFVGDFPKNWCRKKNRIYLLQPDEFEISELNLPKSKRKLIDLYDEITNKCIITARPEISSSSVIDRLEKLNIKLPKYGIHFFPRLKRHSVGRWKGKKIIEICELNKFNKVIFYDDNRNYLRDAKSFILKNSNIEIETIKV